MAALGILDSTRGLPRGMRRLEVGPALDKLLVGDAPDDDAAELKPFAGLRVGGGPVVAHHDFVVFGDHVFDVHVEVGKFLERASYILNRAGRARRHSGRDIGAVVDKLGREVYVANLDVLLVDEFLEMFTDEFAGLRMRQSSLRVDRIHRVSASASVLCASSSRHAEDRLQPLNGRLLLPLGGCSRRAESARVVRQELVDRHGRSTEQAGEQAIG